ncbi:DUF2723 domain-containing protein [Myxococcota bacterium]|nr:DUF2723 domain-containing protein [Myxococcota bacterium]MBU1430488.1 DUF2723 domain-containing protein [Myxococcota bacterium]MBU1899088.1 DUF2723 domain-containing protein [Myxococcota bacterium]
MRRLNWGVGDERHYTAWVFGLSGAFFALTALPSTHWLDTPEFAATAWRLSLSHSPGHPLHALYTRALQTLLPFGDGILRANLGSALAMAAALALFYRLLRALNPPASPLAAVAAALLLGCLPAVWVSAARTEVYALQALLSLLTLTLIHRVAMGEGWALAGLALTFGLAGSNHTLIGAALIPTALLAMGVGVRRLRPIWMAVGMGAAGLATYAYLPLRATAGGVVGWGRPDTPRAFLDALMGREWMKLPGGAAGTPVENIERLMGYLIEQFSAPVSLIFASIFALGLLGLVRQRPWQLLGMAVALASIFATKLYYAFDPLNPDVGGYLIAALALLIALTWMAAGATPPRWRPWSHWAFPLALLWLAPGFDPGGRMGQRGAERVARAFLDDAPPEGVLVFSDFNANFGAWALRAVEGARPDVALIFRGQLNQPWARARLAAEHPAHAARLASGQIDARFHFEPGVQMKRLGPLRARLRPAGLCLALGPDRPASMTRWRWLAGAAPDIDTRRALAFLHAQHALHLQLIHAPPARGQAHLEAASALAPGDALLAEIAGGLDAPHL